MARGRTCRSPRCGCCRPRHICARRVPGRSGTAGSRLATPSSSRCCCRDEERACDHADDLSPHAAVREDRDELPRHALVLGDSGRDDGIGEHQDGRDEGKTGDAHAHAHPTECREYQPRRGAGRDEREYHARQRLRGVSGELLEGESVAEPGPVAERIDVAQEIEPAQAGGDGDRGEHPGGEPARHPQWKFAALLVALAWLVVGVYGVVGYGHNYWRYRGFAPPVDRGTLVKVQFWSQAMRGRRSYKIYLPPGYE